MLCLRVRLLIPFTLVVAGVRCAEPKAACFSGCKKISAQGTDVPVPRVSWHCPSEHAASPSVWRLPVLLAPVQDEQLGVLDPLAEAARAPWGLYDITTLNLTIFSGNSSSPSFHRAPSRLHTAHLTRIRNIEEIKGI